MSQVGGQCEPQVVPWPPHHITLDMRMTDSPDSACEADNVHHQTTPSPNGNIIKAQKALQEVQVRPASPFVPPPPPPPPSNGFHTPNTTWTQLIDSDGDSGIMRLGSTSSSETDHSSSGFPDNYLSKLQVKHFTWIPSKQSNPLGSFITPVRGDHSITTSVPSHSNHQSNRNSSVVFNYHQAHRTSNSHPHSGTNPPRPLSWQRQKSMSIADVRRIQNCNTPPNVLPPSNRPLSLLSFPTDTSAQIRKSMRCSCHTACVHCGAKFANRNFLRSTSDIPSELCVSTSFQSEVPQTTKPSMNVYERLVRKDEDLVFSGYDMIKVHARPVSVIPEPISHRGVTPRQAKSADAASRQRRLQKAYSMTCALDSEELVKAHATVASVIPPNPLMKKNIKCTNVPVMTNSNPSLLTNTTINGWDQQNQQKTPVRPMTPLIPLKLADDPVVPKAKTISAVPTSNYRVINQTALRKEDELKDVCPPPPSVSQSAVTYAKVNKLHKPAKLLKGKHGCSEVITTDDNEPPLPPRNYRSENGSKGHFHISFAGKMRSAKEAFRRAFGLDCNSEDNLVTRNGQKSQRNGKPISPPIPVSNVQRHKTKDQEMARTSDVLSDNYVEI